MAKEDDLLCTFMSHPILKEVYEIPEDELPKNVEEGLASEYPIIQTIATIVKLVQRKSGATDEEIKRQVFLILNSKAI